MILYDHEKKVLCLYDNDKDYREVTLRPKERGIWELLLKNADKPVSRNMMCEEVWAGRYVTDYTINQTINQLRKKIGDDNKSIIITVPKHGYLVGSDFIKFKNAESSHNTDFYNQTDDALESLIIAKKENVFLKMIRIFLNRFEKNGKIRKIISFCFSLKILVLIMVVFCVGWFDKKGADLVAFHDKIENDANVKGLYCFDKGFTTSFDLSRKGSDCYRNLSSFDISCENIVPGWFHWYWYKK